MRRGCTTAQPSDPLRGENRAQGLQAGPGQAELPDLGPREDPSTGRGSCLTVGLMSTHLPLSPACGLGAWVTLFLLFACVGQKIPFNRER